MQMIVDDFDFNNTKVLVVGDLIHDVYVGGDVKRISPEAPVPIVHVQWEKDQLGGAGNVINNIMSLGGNAKVLSYIGKDQSGEYIKTELKNINADVSFLKMYGEIETVKKIRVVSNQQIIRVDYEKYVNPPTGFVVWVKNHIDSILKDVNSVVISDYGKGVVTDELCGIVISECRKKRIPVIVDPKGKKWNKYSGATIITPNFMELSLVCVNEITQQSENTINSECVRLCEEYNFENIVLTRSERGISLVSCDGRKKDFPTVVKEVIDVSGAGDTVVGVIALFISANYSLDVCCVIANIAASIVISKHGTMPITESELRNEICFGKNKVIKSRDICYLVDYLRKQNKKIVFTNGCFDIIHSGHIKCLKEARSFGDVLIVGVNSDKSIKRIKGPKRPIVCQKERLDILESFYFVDYVVLFDDDTPIDLIREIVPDVLVKGSDYHEGEVVGSDVVKANNGVVRLIELKKGRSTSDIIKEIVEKYGRD